MRLATTAWLKNKLKSSLLVVTALVVSTASMVAFMPKTVSAAAGQYVLYANECIFRNQYLQSPNGLYTLWFQDDGNVVLYNRYSNPIWQTGTLDYVYRPYYAGAFCVQGDGNMVIYDYYYWTPIWNTRTAGSGANALYVQNDGNMVLYTPWWAPVWQTYTSGR